MDVADDSSITGARARMHVAEDKRGIALVLLPALAGWLVIVVILLAHLLLPGDGGVTGMLFMCGLIVTIAVLVARDAKAWGLEGAGIALFVIFFFIVGYPFYMRLRGNRGAPLGLGAGLAALALMMLPLVILPLGASLLSHKLAESAASQPQPVPSIVPTLSTAASASQPNAGVDDNVDQATCSSYECRVGIVGDKAKATLALPKNRNVCVRMDYATDARLATLANAPDITKLYLAEAQAAPPHFVAVSDLSPIAKLPQLEELEIWNTRNTDLTALEPLVHLEKLELANMNQMKSLSGLGSLVNLKSLDIPVVSIKDLSPIGALTNLQRLELKFGRDLDISPLANLASLRTLVLMFFHHTSLKPLAGLLSLRTIDLSGDDLLDVDALGALRGLETLQIYAKVPSISFVSKMKGLTHLDADSNPGLKDITPLKGLQALTSLELNETGVEDLTPLATCTHLKTLSIRKTHAKNLAALTGLKELSTLNIAGIDGVDLMPLAKMPGLKNVTLFTGQVPDAALAAFKAAAPSVKLSFSKP